MKKIARWGTEKESNMSHLTRTTPYLVRNYPRALHKRILEKERSKQNIFACYSVAVCI